MKTKRLLTYIFATIMAFCAFMGIISLTTQTAKADGGLFKVTDTASARIDRSGIRFYAEMDQAHYEMAKANGYGFYIFPASYLEGLEDYTDIANDVSTKISISGEANKLYKKGDSYWANAALLDIKAVNFNKEFTCVAYINDANGNPIYAVNEDLAKSLQWVVSKAYFDVENVDTELLMTVYRDGIVDGVPVAEDIVKGFGTETFPIINDEEVKYDLSIKQFDVESFDLSGVKSVEIAGVKTDINGGEMPDMNLQNYTTAGTSQHSADDVLRLTIGESYLETTKLATDKDFAGVTFKFYLNDGTVCEFTNVKLYSKIIKDENDLEAVFGKENIASRLEGYYVLGANIDASGKTFGSVGSQFFGIFDGMGYTISNVGGIGRDESFFGSLQAHATVRNMALVNIKVFWGSAIAGYAGNNQDLRGAWTNPAIENVYVQIDPTSSRFFGIVNNNGCAITHNVIINFAAEANGEAGYGSYAGYSAGSASNVYVISPSYVKCVTSEGAIVESSYEGVVRYENYGEMKVANNDYSSFSSDYWNIEKGVPMWRNAPAVEIVVSDANARAYDLSTKTIDLTGLNFAMTDVKTVEIAGVKTDITNGVMPDMNLQNYTTAGTSQHSADDVLRLTIGETYIETTKLAADKDFAGVTFKFYLNDGTIYELTNVKLYSKIIKNDSDLEAVFGDAYIASRIEGYYVLGANVDASGIDFSGTNKASSNFFGIFDGMGYTISNADVSGRDEGSFFGNVQGHATIRNVAFVNVKATWSNVIANYAGGNSSVGGSGWPNPAMSNVYVSVSSETNTFFGLGRNLDMIISNVVVEYPIEEKSEVCGSFIGGDTAANRTFSNCYVISKTYCTTINDGSGNMVERTYEGLKRYESVELMKEANNNYSSFNATCWEITEGNIPVWKNLPEA